MVLVVVDALGNSVGAIESVVGAPLSLTGGVPAAGRASVRADHAV